VTFYNAAVLSGCIGHPEFADQFTVPPMEILTPLPAEREPIIPDGEVEWEDDYHMTYARVLLPNIDVHAAEATARSLIEGLKTVNHPTKGTRRLLNGRILLSTDNVTRCFHGDPRKTFLSSFSR